MPLLLNGIMVEEGRWPAVERRALATSSFKTRQRCGNTWSRHAVLNVQLTYVNVGSDSPIECTFEFPLEKTSVISKLVAQIDDRVLEAKVKAKEDAKEQYDDAIAAGNTAVFAERDKKNDESITLTLGNLMPG